MSRGGRGGGRGGRLPWDNDPSMKADSKPVELFPPFSVPSVVPLTAQERQVVDYFLLMREQIHSSPLYTQTRTHEGGGDGGGGSGRGGDASGKAYGQDQINRQYGVRNKATVDPFTAVPMYSHRFEKQDRALPDLSGRPFSKDLFPPELWPTLDGVDDGRRPGARGGPRGVGGGGGGVRRSLGGAGAGRRTLALSEVTALRTAEDIFQRKSTATASGGDGGDGLGDDDDDDTRKALEQLEKFKNVGIDSDDNVEFELVEDEGDYDEVEDEAYGDDEEGDYNAEAAFDNGDDDDYGDDYGDDGGGGDEGVY